jgi:hypothetical protein
MLIITLMNLLIQINKFTNKCIHQQFTLVINIAYITLTERITAFTEMNEIVGFLSRTRSPCTSTLEGIIMVLKRVRYLQRPAAGSK